MVLFPVAVLQGHYPLRKGDVAFIDSLISLSDLIKNAGRNELASLSSLTDQFCCVEQGHFCEMEFLNRITYREREDGSR